MVGEVVAAGVRGQAKVLVAVATYNEVRNLPDLVDRVFRHVPTATLLVIDDNSPDGTGRWVAEKSAVNPSIQLVSRPSKMGLGSALMDAMQLAISGGFEYLVHLDGDCSHDPSKIPELMNSIGVAGREGADVAVGSRYVSGGTVDGWSYFRWLMSRCINAYSRAVLALPLHDCSSGMRCFRVSVLSRIDFQEVLSSGYGFQEEILWRLKLVGARFCEVPIAFVDRKYGRSKLGFREVLGALIILARLRIEAWIRGKGP